MLTPTDIHNKEFKKSFRGYNETEIDEFLDRVVADYEKLCRDNEILREKIARSERDVEQYKKLEKNLQDTLLVAQRTAEEVTSAAKKFSVEVRESAAKECQNMKLRAELESRKRVEEAELKARKILEEADLTAKRKLDAADEKVRIITVEYSRLVSDRNQFLLKARAAMEAELALLNDMVASIPRSGAEVSITPQAKEASEDAVKTETASEAPVRDTPPLMMETVSLSELPRTEQKKAEVQDAKPFAAKTTTQFLGQSDEPG